MKKFSFEDCCFFSVLPDIFLTCHATMLPFGNAIIASESRRVEKNSPDIDEDGRKRRVLWGKTSSPPPPLPS